MAVGRDCTLIAITTAFVFCMGMHAVTYNPGLQDSIQQINDLVVIRWNDFASGFPSAGPTDQVKRCMDWQDCSFLTGR